MVLIIMAVSFFLIGIGVLINFPMSITQLVHATGVLPESFTKFVANCLKGSDIRFILILEENFEAFAAKSLTGQKFIFMSTTVLNDFSQVELKILLEPLINKLNRRLSLLTGLPRYFNLILYYHFIKPWVFPGKVGKSNQVLARFIMLCLLGPFFKKKF